METSTSRARFGAFELDLTTGELCSVSPANGEPPVLLREQPFQVLRMLIERAGKLVTREDIKRKLWPDDTIVDFDNSINVSIRILRKAVGDTAEAPRYIETLARRGYRLMVPVEWDIAVTEAEDITKEAVAQVPATGSSGAGAQPLLKQPTKEATPKHWGKSAIAGALALILVVAGYMSWRHSRPVTSSGSGRIML